MASRRFSDADLRAYLDGTAPPALRTAVDKALESDDTLLARLAALDRFGEVVGPAFEAVAARAPTGDLLRVYARAVTATDRSARDTRAAPRPRRWVVPTAFATGLAASFLLGMVVASGPIRPYLDTLAGRVPADEAVVMVPPPEPPAPTWLDAVADYARLFSAATLASVPLHPTTRLEQLAVLSEQVAMDLRPVATGLPGLEMARAELLDLGGKPLGQVAYLSETGKPVLLCVLYRRALNPDIGEPEFTTSERRGLNIVSWSAPRHGLLVIGDVPAEELQTIANVVADRLG